MTPRGWTSATTKCYIRCVGRGGEQGQGGTCKAELRAIAERIADTKEEDIAEWDVVWFDGDGAMMSEP